MSAPARSTPLHPESVFLRRGPIHELVSADRRVDLRDATAWVNPELKDRRGPFWEVRAKQPGLFADEPMPYINKVSCSRSGGSSIFVNL